jgi:RNA polymerase-binding transcription factor DksA
MVMTPPVGRDDMGRPRLKHTNVREARRRLENERSLRSGQLAAIEKLPRYATDELMLALLSTTRRAVEEVDAALRRMDEGTYGMCQGCGAPIPAWRLGVLPQTRFCAPCQRQDHGP